MTISTGIITTYAGSGSTGSTSGSFSGDGGLATSATFKEPYGITISTSGTAILILISSVHLSYLVPTTR